jgi:cyclopropane fatty-acyl-phospholipid synthase-like methyltransferase
MLMRSARFSSTAANIFSRSLKQHYCAAASATVHYIDPASASHYSNHNDVQYHQATTFIDHNRKFIIDPVLDIGCGDGKVTAYFIKH